MQMTLREQLQDPIFKAWFKLEPREQKTAAESPPWHVYVQLKMDGPWRRAQFTSWKAGYKYVKKMLKDKSVHDVSLTHIRQEFRPPVVRQLGKRRYHLPSAPGHIWCGYCRRMTRFAYFRKHHVFRGANGVNSGDRRCSICGIRLIAIRKYT